MTETQRDRLTALYLDCLLYEAHDLGSMVLQALQGGDPTRALRAVELLDCDDPSSLRI